MSESCKFPTCERHPEKNGYCIGHRIYAGEQQVKEPKKQIARQSEKRKEDHKAYLKIVKEMMKVSDRCDIKEVGCTGKATGLHHKKKRSPATLLDKTLLIRACNNCNLWVENNPQEAIDKGYSVSKHIKNEVHLTG